jgi:hypothetical protein
VAEETAQGNERDGRGGLSMTPVNLLDDLMKTIAAVEAELAAARAKKAAQDKQMDLDIANAEKGRPPETQQPPS